MREAGCTNFKLSLGRDNRSRNVDAIMTIEYFVEGLHHVVLASSF